MTLDAFLSAKGYTQTVFAGMIGISQAHVNRLCSGKAWPGRELAEKIRDVTEGAVTADDFLSPETARSESEGAPA